MPLSYFEPVIGSSFDALAAQRGNWAQFNRQVEEGNLARKAAADAAAQNYFQTVAAQQQRAMELDANNQREDQRYQFSVNAQDQARQDALAQRQQQYEFQKSQEEERKAEAAKSFDLQSRQLDISEGKDPSAFKRYEFNYNNAVADADAGAFGSPADVLKLYPSLKQEDAQQLAELSLRARPSVTSQHEQAANVAKVLNEYNLLKDQIETVTKDADKAGGDRNSGIFTLKGGSGLLTPWNWFDQQPGETATSREQQIAAMTDRLAKLEPVATAYEKDKNLNQIVRFDPNLGRYGGYRPTVSTPSWFSTGTGTAGSPAADLPTQTGTLAPMPQTPPTVTSAAQFDALPTGTKFYDVGGNLRVK